MIRRSLTLLLILTAACAAPGTDEPPPDLPADAWGEAADHPLHDGADLITEDEAHELEGDHAHFHHHGRDDEALAAVEHAAQDAADEAIHAWFDLHGVGDHAALHLIDEAPDLANGDEERVDGNLSITVAGHEGHVTTLGRPALLHAIANSLARVDDPGNGSGAYRLLHGQLTGQQAADLGLPSPDTIDHGTDLDQLHALALIATIIDDVQDIAPLPPPPPASRPTRCDGEVGAGLLTDRTGQNPVPATTSADGLFATMDWFGKWNPTCVKDQANRGTCVAFGMTAALEAAHAKASNEWVNLSEQDLYFQLRGMWTSYSYGDGADASWGTLQLVSRAYDAPYESAWPYNRSDSRIEVDATQIYLQSCLGYQWYQPPSGPVSNYCSDTAHQGGAYCYNDSGFQFCGYASPVSTAGGSGVIAQEAYELWDPSDPARSVASVQFALWFGLPVVLGTAVPPSFSGPDADGFVTFVGAGEPSRGGHVYLAMGALSNEQITPTLPGAPQGSGGGYILAKNSWGEGYADGGYVYLPLDWVEAYAFSATVVASSL